MHRTVEWTTVMDLQIHTNAAFRKMWNPELAMQFPVQIPDAMANEVNKLMLVGGCVFLNSHKGFRVHAERNIKNRDSMTGAEYSLNKRHIFEYSEQAHQTLENSLGVFGRFKDLVHTNAIRLGVSAPLGFLWATPIKDEASEPHQSDPIMSFFRVIPKDPAVVISDIELFQQERVLILTFGTVQ